MTRAVPRRQCTATIHYITSEARITELMKVRTAGPCIKLQRLAKSSFSLDAKERDSLLSSAKSTARLAQG
jgi:hypothetical protein